MWTSRLAAVLAVLAVMAVCTTADTARWTDVAAPPRSGDSIRVPLRYAPTWLPDGLVEGSRILSSPGIGHDRLDRGPTVDRLWTAVPGTVKDGDPYVSVSVRSTTSPDFTCEGGRAVDVGGASAVFRRWETKACVDRQVDGRTRVVVEAGGAGVNPDDALRIARSVRPTGAYFIVPFRLLGTDVAYLNESPGTYVRVTGTSPTDWTAVTEISPEGRDDPRGLTITLGTTTDVPPGGSDLPVGGRPGRHASTEGAVGRSSLVVEYGPRLLLTVTFWRARGENPPARELVKVAKGIRVGTPDMSWIGART